MLDADAILSALVGRSNMATLTSIEVIERTGITYRQLDYWTRTGLLISVVGNQPGSGKPRVYDEEEVRVARLLAVVMPLNVRGHFGDSAIHTLCDRVRDGNLGVVTITPGVMLDFDVICAEPDDDGDLDDRGLVTA